MAENTAIEWTDATWNPVRGCTRVSPGCGGANHEGGCYAEKIAARFSGPGQPFHGFAERTKHGGRWTGKLALVESALDLPLRWRKPRRIFVNSMSDLFHETIPDEMIDRVFAVMALAPQHTFQVLTKRAERMREYLTADDGLAAPRRQIDFLKSVRDGASTKHEQRSVLQHITAAYGWAIYGEAGDWPLPNVWLGVSVEDQARADERIPLLLDTPAAKRFISAEPLLGPVRLPGLYPVSDDDDEFPIIDTPALDLVIVGGESGPNARPMHPGWARKIRDDCAAAGVPFFFKQWGAWLPDTLLENMRARGVVMRASGEQPSDADMPAIMDGTFDFTGFQHFSAVGKKAAGRLLDGVEHNEMPACSAWERDPTVPGED